MACLKELLRSRAFQVVNLGCVRGMSLAGSRHLVVVRCFIRCSVVPFKLSEGELGRPSIFLYCASLEQTGLFCMRHVSWLFLCLCWCPCRCLTACCVAVKSKLGQVKSGCRQGFVVMYHVQQPPRAAPTPVHCRRKCSTSRVIWCVHSAHAPPPSLIRMALVAWHSWPPFITLSLPVVLMRFKRVCWVVLDWQALLLVDCDTCD